MGVRLRLSRESVTIMLLSKLGMDLSSGLDLAVHELNVACKYISLGLPGVVDFFLIK